MRFRLVAASAFLLCLILLLVLVSSGGGRSPGPVGPGPGESDPGAAAGRNAGADSGPERDGAEPVGEKTAAGVEGFVYEFTGDFGDREPAPGARVRAYRKHGIEEGAPWLAEWSGLDIVDRRRPGEPFTETGVDVEGRFSLDLPEGGTWLLRADAPGLAPAQLTLGSRKDLVRIFLAPVHSRRFRVVDPAGRGIAGVTVLQLTGSGEPPIAETRSDDSGWFDLEIVDWHSLLLSHAEYASQWRDGLADPDLTTFVMHPGATLTGRVVDGAGRPVAGASVHVSHAFGEVVITDASGSFRFDGLPADPAAELELLVQAADRDAVRWPATTGGGPVEVVLPGPATISGRVLLPDGSPAAGARVFFRDLAEENSGPRVAAGPEGTFRLEGVVPGRVGVFARHWTREGERDIPVARYLGRTFLDLGEDEHRDGVEIRLRPRPVSFFAIRVVDGAGDPVPDCRVFSKASWAGSSTAITDEDGVAVGAMALDPGTEIALHVSPPGRDRMPARPGVRTRPDPDSPPERVELLEPRFLTVRVRAVEGAAIPPGLPIRVDVSSARGPVREVASGVFHFPMDPGSWIHARASAEGWTSRKHYGPPATEVELRLAPVARVRGRLVAAREWVEEPEITAWMPREGDLDELWPVVDQEEGGEFRLDEVPPGRLHLFLGYPHDGGRLFATVRVEPGDDLDLETIRIDDVPAVSGRVLGPSRSPLAGVEIRAWPEDADRVLGTTRTTKGGTFSLPLPPDLPAWLEIRHAGCGTRVVRVVPDGNRTPLRIELAAEGRLRVRLPADLPYFRSVRIRVREPGSPVAFAPPGETVAPEGPDGGRVVLLRGLPAGRLTVTLETRDPAGRPVEREREVEVLAGGVSETAFDL